MKRSQRGGKREGSGRKSKIIKASTAAKNDSSQGKLPFGVVARRNTAHQPPRQNELNQQPNVERTWHEHNLQQVQRAIESSDEEENEIWNNCNEKLAGDKKESDVEKRQREVSQLFEQFKYCEEGAEVNPEDLEENLEDIDEEERPQKGQKSRMQYQPPVDSILGSYLQRRRIQLTGSEITIATSPRWIVSDCSPLNDPYNPASYYLENVCIYLHDPVLQYKKQHKKGHQEFACLHCGCKGKLSWNDWFYRPAHHGDTVDWILHRRYHCKGNNKDKGCGKTFASFHPDFLKQFPEYVADSFPFVMTDHSLGMHESMAHQINETKKMKYWKQHASYIQNVERRVVGTRKLGITTDYIPTPFSPFDQIGCYNGIELRAALVRQLFIKMMMTNEDYMQESFQLILGKSESPDHTFRFPKMIRCFKLGGKCYNATYDSINEFGEPTMNIFCHTKANDELKPAIMDNKLIREQTGAPSLLRIESDGGGDSAVWQEVFHEDLVKRTNPYKPLWRNGLPRAELPDSKIERFGSAASLEIWVLAMLDKLDSEAPIYYGLDTEQDYNGRTKLIQVCLPTNLFPKVVVVDLGKIGAIGQANLEDKLGTFKTFLEHKQLIPVAVNVTYDLRKLEELGVNRSGQNAIELMHLASQVEPNHPQGYSLQNICARTLGIYVAKESQHDSWETITDDLVKYAALDAYLHLLLYQKLEKALHSGSIDGEAVLQAKPVAKETIVGNRVRVIFGGITFGFATLDFVGGDGGEIRKVSGYTIGKGQCIVALDELCCRSTKPRNGFRIVLGDGNTLLTVAGKTIASVFNEHSVGGKLYLVWDTERVSVVLEPGESTVASKSTGRRLRSRKRPRQSIGATGSSLDQSHLLLGDKVPARKSSPSHPRSREKRDRFHIFQSFPSSRDKDVKARLIVIRRLAFQALTVFDAEDLQAVHKYLREAMLVDNWDDVIDFYFFNKEWWYERVRMYPPDADRGVDRLKYVIKYIHMQPQLKDSWELVEKWFDSAIELSEEGHLEETPDVCMFQWKGRDSNGLNLYFRRRGSNRSELLHQKMRIALGSHGVGAEVGHFLILWITYRFKVRSGITRRGYHDFGMFNLQIIDRIQKMYENVFSRNIFPKHRNQLDANVIKGKVMVGIRPLNYDSNYVKQGAPHESLKGDLLFMAKRSGVQCIPTPIATRREKAIFADFIGLRTKPTSRHWIELANVFAQKVDYDQVFPKLPSMLKSYFNRWKVTQGIKCIQLQFRDSMYGVLAELMQVERNESAVVAFQRTACRQEKKAKIEIRKKPEQTNHSNSLAQPTTMNICQPTTYGPKIPTLNDLRLEGGICVGAFLGCNRTGAECKMRMRDLLDCAYVKAHRISVVDMNGSKAQKAEFGNSRKAKLQKLKRVIKQLGSEAEARRILDIQYSEKVDEKQQSLHEETLEAEVQPVVVKVEKMTTTSTASAACLLENKRATGKDKSIAILDSDLAEAPVPSKHERVVATCGTQTLQAQSLDRLQDGRWLNDEVINFWLARLQGEAGSRIHIMNTQFMTKLLDQKLRTEEPSLDKYKYENVKKWLKKANVDLFSLDKLILPINIINNHWLLACIFVQKECIQIFNSMAPTDEKDQKRHEMFLQALLYYVQDVHEERGYPLPNVSKWKRTIDDPMTPRQRNYFDCGIFVCMYAEYLCGKRSFDFSQDDACSHRQSMRETIEQMADR